MTGNAQLRFVDEKRLLSGPDPAGTYTEHVLPAKIAIDIDYARSRSLLGDVSILAPHIGTADRPDRYARSPSIRHA